MRSYLDATTLPTVKIAGVPLPRLILGNLPFLGESYQGAEKNRIYTKRFLHLENTVNILRHAIEDFGLTVIGVMPPTMGELSRLFFEALRKVSTETEVDVGLISCFRIPLSIGGERVDDYRRWMTYHSFETQCNRQVTKKYLSDPILLCREGWKEKLPEALTNLKPYSSEEIADLKLERSRLDKMLSAFSGFRTLLAEPGSETDFLALARRTDILEEVVRTSTRKLECPVVVGTHHAGSTIPILDASGISISGYVTPVNSIGALMLPSQRQALEALSRTRKSLIAIKAMAGGRVTPNDAFEYVFSRVGAGSCMVGVASETELGRDVQAARRFIFQNRQHRRCLHEKV